MKLSRFFLLFISLVIFSCQTDPKEKGNNQNNKSESQSGIIKEQQTETKGAQKENSGKTMANESDPFDIFSYGEFLVEYPFQEENFKDIIQLYNTFHATPDRKLIEKFKIGRDIKLDKGNLKWVLFSTGEAPYLQIHFILSTDNETTLEYVDFPLLSSELVTVFKFIYNDSKNGLRQFIVVITKDGKHYYNNIYEITCTSNSNYCSINELFVCNDFPVAKNAETFKKVFPAYMVKKHQCKTPKKNYDTRFDGMYFKPEHKAILYHINKLKKETIVNIFNKRYFNGKVSFHCIIDDFFTIGQEIKLPINYEYLFFRKYNGNSEICFINKDTWSSHNHHKISLIERLSLPKNATIVSVFGYTNKFIDDTNNKFIVVINKTNANKYYTSIFWEFCGAQPYCSMEQIIFNNHDELFKNIKSYDDFIKAFPKIYKENEYTEN